MGLITHTDFWCNNLLFKRQLDNSYMDNCVILDWQMITYSRPTNDIALLITSSLPSNVRRQQTPKLLDLYWNVLKTNCLKLSLDIEVDLQYSRNKMECDFRYVISRETINKKTILINPFFLENLNFLLSYFALDQLMLLWATVKLKNVFLTSFMTSTKTKSLHLMKMNCSIKICQGNDFFVMSRVW